eukprot:TRINITY_DN4629_c0_g1_i3.p1 TRINITY_DN4629_c0_g1~~TRINITY_DN4629_c0_g1_i3.p1  ORF type:complete len:926 (+),score=73.57 TRINITY_DN4629_c0_g1_i3:351-3128(+)
MYVVACVSVCGVVWCAPGMAFPSEGLEKTYRNNIDDVARLLDERHKGHYMIYNLAAPRSYDYKKFDNKVHTWCAFPDHHSPPLSLLFKICHSIHLWLLEDPANVVVVHCLAGKGRTGTVIGAYFIYSGLFNNAGDALQYFAGKRSLTLWGVTNPSQRRVVEDFALTRHGEKPFPEPLMLKKIRMHTIPNFDNRGCAPYVELFGTNKGYLIFSGAFSPDTAEPIEPPFCPCDGPQVIDFPIRRPVRSDIVLVFKHVTPIYRTEPIVPMFRVQFHTGLLKLKRKGANKHICIFNLSDLDDAYKDKRFSRGFKLELIFANMDEDAIRAHIAQEEELMQEEFALWNMTPAGPLDGSTCFFPAQPEALKAKIEQAQHCTNVTGRTPEKSGYLTKQGHRVKNWKRRWWVLKDGSLSYFKNPRALKPLGTIPVDSIMAVMQRDDHMGAEAVFAARWKPAHETPVTCLLCVEKYLWTGCADGSLSLWDSHTGTIYFSFQAHEKGSPITSLVLARDYVLSAGDDGVIHVWDKMCNDIIILKGHEIHANICMTYVEVKDVRMLFSADSTGSIRIWNMSQFKCEGSIKLDLGINAMCVFGPTIWLAVDCLLYTFDYRNWKTKGIPWKAHDKPITSILRVGPDIWTCSEDRSIHVWSGVDRTKIKTLRRQNGTILNLALIGHDVWSSADDDTVVLWNAKSRKFASDIKSKHAKKLIGVVDIGAGTVLSISQNDRSVVVWNYIRDITNCFELVTGAESYFVQADTQEERDDWVELIDQVRAKAILTSEAVSRKGNKIQVRVVQLRDLASRGAEDESGFIFARVMLAQQDPVKSYSTALYRQKSRQDDPQFDHEPFEFTVLNQQAELMVQVWQQGEKGASDTLLGFVTLAVQELMLPGTERVDTWLGLRQPGEREKGLVQTEHAGVGGDVRIVVTFTTF